jgi:histidinol dehydrogenase
MIPLQGMRTFTIQNNDFSKVMEFLKPANVDSALEQTVSDIISEIAENGDEQLTALTNRFDRNNLTAPNLLLGAEQPLKAYKTLSSDAAKALEHLSVRIHNFYERLKPQDLFFKDKSSVRLGARYIPVPSVGIYAPAGFAASVLMCAIPARVAGVARICLVNPAPDGRPCDKVLAAAKICGITEIYQIGGAQAIAALTLGTESIKPVDKIIGFTGTHATEAMLQLGHKPERQNINIIFADDKNPINWLAADILAATEYAPNRRLILVTNSQNYAQQVVSAVYDTLPSISRGGIAKVAIEQNSAVIVLDNFDEAANFANQAAPQAVQLAIDTPEDIAQKITNTASICMGRFTAKSFTDYMAGVSIYNPANFMKLQTITMLGKKAIDELAPKASLLAGLEGMQAHAMALSLRSKHGE